MNLLLRRKAFVSHAVATAPVKKLITKFMNLQVNMMAERMREGTEVSLVNGVQTYWA